MLSFWRVESGACGCDACSEDTCSNFVPSPPLLHKVPSFEGSWYSLLATWLSVCTTTALCFDNSHCLGRDKLWSKLESNFTALSVQLDEFWGRSRGLAATDFSTFGFFCDSSPFLFASFSSSFLFVRAILQSRCIVKRCVLKVVWNTWWMYKPTCWLDLIQKCMGTN